jgi:hypothetical protein
MKLMLLSEKKLSLNILKLSSSWLFIVYGFYGYGISKVDQYYSLKALLFDISIATVFLVYIKFGVPNSHVFLTTIRFRVLDLYLILFFLLLLSLLNRSWMLQSLNGDELSTMLLSQRQSYVLLKALYPFLGTIGDVQFRYLIQWTSMIILIALILFFKIVNRKAKLKTYIYFMLFLTVFSRAILIIGSLAASGPWPPGESFYYFLGSTILSPSHLSYRILALLLQAVFLVLLLNYSNHLKNKFSLFDKIIIFSVIATIPVLRQISMRPMLALWSFYFVSTSIIFLSRREKRAGIKYIAFAALLTSFRFPILAFIVPVLILDLNWIRKNMEKDERRKEHILYLISLIFTLPITLIVITTRLANTLTNTLSLNSIISTHFEIMRIIPLNLSILSILLIIFSLYHFRNYRYLSRYIIILILINYFLYFIVNSGPLASASIYLIEWLIPLLVAGIFLTLAMYSWKMPLGFSLRFLTLILLSMNISDYSQIPTKVQSNAPQFMVGQDIAYEHSNDILWQPPFRYSQAIDTIKDEPLLRNCLIVGTVYGVPLQILAGYSLKDTMSSLDVLHYFIRAQESIGEDQITSSIVSISKSNTHCVILGYVSNRADTIRDLVNNGWKNRGSFIDPTYKTQVVILTKSPI